MAYIVENMFNENPNHPCHGKDCKDCETCIFDIDIFDRDKYVKQNINKQNMCSSETCHLCGQLIKNYIDDDRIRFNACCGRSLISYNNMSRPRIIQANVGPMLPLETPTWCPKKRGITKEYVAYKEDNEQSETKNFPLPVRVETPKAETPKYMTYAEKREKLMSFPKRVEWDDIEEDGVYVIPKILTQSRKVVRVVMKTDNLLRCSEIDEFGKENTVLTSIYPRDIDAVFITKVLKY